MSKSARLVDVDHATAQLGVSRPTLYRWLRNGRIRGVKVGRQWRVEQNELERVATGQAPAIEPPSGLDSLMAGLAARMKELKLPSLDNESHTAEAAAQCIIRLAGALRASDIHLEPRARGAGETDDTHALLRFRIDGVMGCPVDFDLRALPAIVDQFKTWANCNLSEKRRPQDGRIIMTVADRQIDLRICFVPTVLGESVTLRILDQKAVLIFIDRFNYTPAQAERLEEALRSPSGLILATGPTGSGKTTTLYACLNQLVSPDCRIMTIEDPVEYLLPGMTQVAVDPRVGVTYHTAMRAVLRSDPDVIMVGEIRDRESAEVCHQAALSGHLVLSTLHTNDAPLTLMRLIDMGVEPFAIAEAVRLVVAQRLIRMLCPDCRTPVGLTGEALDMATALAEDGGIAWTTLPSQFHEAVGCGTCGDTGYRGRRVVTEMLAMTASIKAALCDEPDAADLRRHAIADGMTTMAADAVRLASHGETSLDEVFRLAAGMDAT